MFLICVVDVLELYRQKCLEMLDEQFTLQVEAAS